MTPLERAIEIALDAHAGQTDKAGAPYILHPLRLMLQMDDPDAQMAAVLHDVVEDSSWTIEALREAGLPEAVLTAVDHLTRRADETYEAFVARAGRDPVARVVKLADLEDNLDVRRLSAVTEKDRARLERYLRARQHLLQRSEKGKYHRRRNH